MANQVTSKARRSVKARFVPGTRFTQRPVAREKESWPSALMGFAAANGFDGINDLARVLGLRGLQLLRAPATVAWDALREGRNFEAQTQVGPAGDQRLSYSRVCFACLQADKRPYIRGEWDLPLSLVCQIHGTLLVDTCEWCGRRIDYFRTDIALCPCGESFERAPVVVPAWVTPMLGLFLSDDDGRQQGQFAEASANEVHAARALERIAEHEMQQSTLFLSGKRVDAPMLRRGHLEGLKPWFERGTVSFVEKMRGLGGEEDSWMRARLSLKLYLFPKVSAVLKAARMTRPMRERRMEKSATADEEVDFYRLANVADDFHASFQAVKRWVSSGRLPGVVVEKGKQSRVPASSYARLKELFESSLCIRDASKVLGCSEQAVQALANQGAIQRLFLSPSVRSDRISSESLTNWRASLSARSADPVHAADQFAGAPGSVAVDFALQLGIYEKKSDSSDEGQIMRAPAPSSGKK
jgi:hypothetical protein